MVSHEETDQVHCGPGPFSMSGPDMVSAMMTGVGFTEVGFERFDADICIGRNLDDAVEFAMALGPAGEIMRLAGAEGERLKPQVCRLESSASTPTSASARPDDAVEFAMALGPAGEIMRLAGSEGERLKPQVVAALRETLSTYERPDGVWAPSSTWFITAMNPG